MKPFVALSVVLGLALLAALVFSIYSFPRAGVGFGGQGALQERVATLEAERDVLQVLDQLDFAVDQKEWDTVRGLFLDEIDVDLTSLGGAPAPMAADTLVDGWRSNLFEGKPSFHMRGGAVVTVEGDTAHVVATEYVLNTLPQRSEAAMWEVWGRYDYTFAKTEAGWRIAGLTFGAFHSRGDQSIRSEFAPAE